MSRGTYTPPKPPTAKQTRKVFLRFEQSFNEIVELTKRFDPETVAGREARWISDAAFQLHGQLSALLRFLDDEERETMK